MSNNKFHFEFKKRTPKIQDTRSKEKLQLLHLSLKFIIFICLKNNIYIFLNYNKYKLLTFTKKNRRVFEHACECVLKGLYRID